VNTGTSLSADTYQPLGQGLTQIARVMGERREQIVAGYGIARTKRWTLRWGGL